MTYRVVAARVPVEALATFLEDAIPSEELLSYRPPVSRGLGAELWRGVHAGSTVRPRVSSWTDSRSEAEAWTRGPGGQVVHRYVDACDIVAVVLHEGGVTEFVVVNPQDDTAQPLA